VLRNHNHESVLIVLDGTEWAEFDLNTGARRRHQQFAVKASRRLLFLAPSSSSAFRSAYRDSRRAAGDDATVSTDPVASVSPLNSQLDWFFVAVTGNGSIVHCGVKSTPSPAVLLVGAGDRVDSSRDAPGCPAAAEMESESGGGEQQPEATCATTDDGDCDDALLDELF
jgi:hypothetical protein